VLTGVGAVTVLIAGQPAWRALPATAAAGLQGPKRTGDATIKAAEAATLAAAGTPGAPAALANEQAIKANVGAAMAALIASTVASAAAAVAAQQPAVPGTPDVHTCSTPLPLPPHGPGVAIEGSATVLINGLPACRQGDTLLEALGPPNSIALGCPTVIIGD
jgi:uncharacterized Zn-binding protein involved in type VI secretion